MNRRVGLIHDVQSRPGEDEDMGILRRVLMRKWAKPSQGVNAGGFEFQAKKAAVATCAGVLLLSSVFAAVSPTAFAKAPGRNLIGISVTPPSASITQGETEPFTAIGSYSNGSTQNVTGTVTWASSNTAVATVSNASGSKGLATGLGVGKATISAKAKGNPRVSGSATLTVTAPALTGISVLPASASIAQGQTQPFTATGTYSNGSTQNVTGSVTWASSNSAVATVSNGLATGQGVGSTTITASLGGVTGSATLTVTSLVPPPTNLRVLSGNGTVTLAWEPSTGDVIGYIVEYGTVSGGPYPNMIQVGNVTTCTVGGLTNGTTYFFVVVAMNTAGELSGPSNQVEASPSA